MFQQVCVQTSFALLQGYTNAAADFPPTYHQYQLESYPAPEHPYKNQYIPNTSFAADVAPPPYYLTEKQ